MRVSLFIKNTAILTVYSVLLRIMGMIFRIFMINRIGAECTGLYQQIFSVYMLLTGALCVGMSTAVTGAVSREAVRGTKEDIRGTVSRACLISFCASTVICVGAFSFSSEIAVIIGEPSCANAVRILSLSIPFMGISACFKGYFSAIRNTLSPSNAQLIEQTVRITAVCVLLTVRANADISETCAYILLGDLIAETASCAAIFLLYRASVKKTVFGKYGRCRIGLLRVAIPVGLGRLSTSALRTAENLILPDRLTVYFNSRSKALEIFGTVKGMALPVLLFPSAVLGSASSLMIPELAEASALGNTDRIRRCTEKAIGTTLYFSIFFAAVFHLCAGELGEVIYRSEDAASVMRMLAPVVPLMYLELVSDGLLKGLDKQAFTLICGLADSVLRIALIKILLADFGLRGFIGVMIFSNAFTSLLCLFKLARVSHMRICALKHIILPTAAAGACYAVGHILSLGASSMIVRLAIKLLSSATVYFTLTNITKIKKFLKMPRRLRF